MKQPKRRDRATLWQRRRGCQATATKRWRARIKPDGARLGWLPNDIDCFPPRASTLHRDRMNVARQGLGGAVKPLSYNTTQSADAEVEA